MDKVAATQKSQQGNLYTCLNCKNTFELLYKNTRKPRYFCSLKCRSAFEKAAIEKAVALLERQKAATV